jgi:hypothetical protein
VYKKAANTKWKKIGIVPPYQRISGRKIMVIT